MCESILRDKDTLKATFAFQKQENYEFMSFKGLYEMLLLSPLYCPLEYPYGAGLGDSITNNKGGLDTKIS